MNDTPNAVAGVVDADSDLFDPVLRDRALQLLAELSRLYPTYRLGQLVSGIGSSGDTDVPFSVYDIEDREFIASAERWLEYRRANPPADDA
jgi:hypothetical protein